MLVSSSAKNFHFFERELAFLDSKQSKTRDSFRWTRICAEFINLGRAFRRAISVRGKALGSWSPWTISTRRAWITVLKRFFFHAHLPCSGTLYHQLETGRRAGSEAGKAGAEAGYLF